MNPHQAIGPLERRLRFRLRTSGVESVALLLWWRLRCILSSAAGAVGDAFLPPNRREERRHRREERAVRTLVGVLGRLKGAFVKAGQFASHRQDLVPDRHRSLLAPLHDRVPPLPLDQIRPVIESSLNLPLESAFLHFEPQPLGSASLAQVHRARLHDGRLVAVKVQYPWLEAACASDLRILGWVLRRWARQSQRHVDPDRLMAEFARGLESELDFEHEARTAGEIAHNLEMDEQIVVPKVVSSHTRKRILTVEYLDAVRVDDLAALARLGIQPRSVLEPLARAYAKQIFVDGLFHADPHPGNLFVLDEPEAAARPRILFVDFGLSQRLSPELRRDLRSGIFALLQRKPADFVEQMDRMGMLATGAREDVTRSIEAMFDRIARTGEGAGALASSSGEILGLKDEAALLLEKTPGIQLPTDLLLYARTLSTLFALAARIDPEIDMMKLSLPYLLRFLAERS